MPTTLSLAPGDPVVVAHVRWPVEWDALEDMQGFVTRYARRSWGGELGERARLGACELLENAVRYAPAGSWIELELVDASGRFEVRVTNDAVAARVALLQRHVERISGADATQLYQHSVRRMFLDASSERGGLGLLRLRNEVMLDLSVHVEGRRVTVVAAPRRVAMLQAAGARPPERPSARGARR